MQDHPVFVFRKYGNLAVCTFYMFERDKFTILYHMCVQICEEDNFLSDKNTLLVNHGKLQRYPWNAIINIGSVRLGFEFLSEGFRGMPSPTLIKFSRSTSRRALSNEDVFVPKILFCPRENL